jgi:hypothetical protein
MLKRFRRKIVTFYFRSRGSRTQWVAAVAAAVVSSEGTMARQGVALPRMRPLPGIEPGCVVSMSFGSFFVFYFSFLG